MRGDLLLALKKDLDAMFDYMADVYIGSDKFDRYIDEMGTSLTAIVDLHIKGNTEVVKSINAEYQKSRDTRLRDLNRLSRKLHDDPDANLLGTASSKILSS